MLYFVKRGDTLANIASRFRTSINSLLRANLICNPNLITVGLPLIIPRQGISLPKSGAGPYYIVLPGDTLYCIAQNTGVSINNIVNANQITNPNLIYPGTELLTIAPTTNDPAQLKERWENTPDENCEVFGFTEYGVYYVGSFEWAAFGSQSISYLIELLNHRCEIVRRYAIIALGRLALDSRAVESLSRLLGETEIGQLAGFALRKIRHAQQGRKKVHITLSPSRLLAQPQMGSLESQLSAGTEITVLRWFIPSPTQEEGPIGGLQIYDYIRVNFTGQTGFLPRAGNNQLIFI